MTQEDKELLLKDLSARLPYGVKVKFGSDVIPSPLTPDLLGNYWYTVDIYLKPYLRPLYSMTEAEREEYKKVIFESQNIDGISSSTYVSDWLMSKHFDTKGLIPKGLALKAPEGMYS